MAKNGDRKHIDCVMCRILYCKLTEKIKMENTEKKEKKPLEISVHTGQITHREFAKHNDKFRAACKAVDIKPSNRQASKWRRGLGSARKAKN